MRICGTCRFWQTEVSKRPASLRGTFSGKCKLNGKEYKVSDMQDCFGWKERSKEGENAN